MRTRTSALVAVIAAMATATGVALAAPVPILSISDGGSEFVAPFDPSESLTYSYRQSIYQVTVFEELVRADGGIGIRGVRSSDIRSVEYFGWKGEPRVGADGLWSEAAPATVSPDRELVIRITPAGEQRFTTARWSMVLRPRFGETVVRVRAEDRPLVVAMLESGR